MPGENTNFVYVLFGDNEAFYAEAAYSIGTLRRRLNPEGSRIIVFTDHPDKVRAWPVTTVSIAGQIGEMKGVLGYGLRIKLCCLLQCLKTYSGNAIFVDSDTFFKKSPETLIARLKEGCALMYQRNHLAPEDSPFKNLRLLLPGGSDYQYGRDACMFNSGVIGLRQADGGIIKTALAICDAYLQQSARKSHICEQLAISEAIRIAGHRILEADDVIVHYYRGNARKYMRHQISSHKSRQGREPWEVEEPLPYSYLRLQWFKVRQRLPG